MVFERRISAKNNGGKQSSSEKDQDEKSPQAGWVNYKRNAWRARASVLSFARAILTSRSQTNAFVESRSQ